jgi:uncharacterized protein YcfJ
MDKSMVKGLVIGAVVAITGGAVAGYKLIDSEPKFAQVLGVQPVTKTVRTPREVCRDEVVQQQAPTRDPRRITGTAIGAVVGGVLGNQIGHGSGRAAATVGGAAVGGVIGHQIEKHVKGPAQAAQYRYRVRMDDGSYQTYAQDFDAGVRAGDRVRVDQGRVYRL